MDTPHSILKQFRLKSTPGRIRVLQALISTTHPLSAESLFVSTEKVVDLSTIYRTLNEFADKGIVDTLHIEKNKVLFEIHHGRTHHHHIICTKCNKIEDIESCGLDELSKKILTKSQTFKTITKHSLEFFGVCNNCSKKSL